MALAQGFNFRARDLCLLILPWSAIPSCLQSGCIIQKSWAGVTKTLSNPMVAQILADH